MQKESELIYLPLQQIYTVNKCCGAGNASPTLH